MDFPIIAIAIIGIFATAFLLLSYYLFVIKCCLNWHRADLFHRFSLTRRRSEPFILPHYPAPPLSRGLDESVIRSIPIFKYKKSSSSFSSGECECSVCLNEFLEDEKLRVIPNCSHVFHIDCIDVWLQTNANCPLCRTSISTTSNYIVAPSSTPQDPMLDTENLIGNEEDFVVIELGSSTDQRLNQVESISPSFGKLEHRVNIMGKKKAMTYGKLTSMGDECISREKDEQFSVQPLRRSFSMDSSVNRELYLAVQEALQKGNTRQGINHGDHDNHGEQVISPIEGCSNRSIRRSFFSFGHSRRGSRSTTTAVLPVYFEP